MQTANSSPFFIIDEDQIRSSVSMKESIALMRTAFVSISSGEAPVPVRSRLDVTAKDACVVFMPVLVSSLNCIAVKVVSVFPHNTTDENIPSIHGKLLLINSTNGVPICLLD